MSRRGQSGRQLIRGREGARKGGREGGSYQYFRVTTHCMFVLIDWYWYRCFLVGRNGNKDIVEFLIDAGAEPRQLLNLKGETALDVAKTMHIFQLLMLADAKMNATRELKLVKSLKKAASSKKKTNKITQAILNSKIGLLNKQPQKAAVLFESRAANTAKNSSFDMGFMPATSLS